MSCLTPIRRREFIALLAQAKAEGINTREGGGRCCCLTTICVLRESGAGFRPSSLLDMMPCIEWLAVWLAGPFVIPFRVLLACSLAIVTPNNEFGVRLGGTVLWVR